MSQAVRQFFSLLNQDHTNDEISDAWEELSIKDRIYAVSIAEGDEIEMIAGREEIYDSEESLMFV